MKNRRKHRDYEYTCNCGIYAFPHRIFGGKCEGIKIVSDTFENNALGTAGECAECVMSDCYSCQVLDGIENVKNSPCLQDFVRFEGIKTPIYWRSSLSSFKSC